MKLLSLLLLLALCGMGARTAGAEETSMKQETAIALPGVEKRIDHFGADITHHRLFVAALGNNTIEVIDLNTAKRVQTLSGLHEPQGIVFTPASNRVFAANAQGGDLNIYDASSYKKVGTVPFGEDADNVRYDAKANRIYVGYGSGALGILDAASLKRLGSITLVGHPESFQLEKSGSRIFVNVPSAGQIAVLDRATRKVLTTWPVTVARSNFPMALDEAHHRLFVGCREPATLLVYDTQSGHVVASLPIVGDTDDLFYDAAAKQIYVSGGEGFLDVIAQKTPDHYARTHHIPTASGARTSFFVPELRRLYLAVPHRNSQETQIRVYAVDP
jgi:DNA-binding beta-propeller fold protein YncE